jgi:hypothetical protein
MADTTARRVSEERAASPEEIRAAIDGLTIADFGRLRRFGDYQILLLREKAGDRIRPSRTDSVQKLAPML